jgi:hypothetical protein
MDHGRRARRTPDGRYYLTILTNLRQNGESEKTEAREEKSNPLPALTLLCSAVRVAASIIIRIYWPPSAVTLSYLSPCC